MWIFCLGLFSTIKSVKIDLSSSLIIPDIDLYFMLVYAFASTCMLLQLLLAHYSLSPVASDSAEVSRVGAQPELISAGATFIVTKSLKNTGRSTAARATDGFWACGELQMLSVCKRITLTIQCVRGPITDRIARHNKLRLITC